MSSYVEGRKSGNFVVGYVCSRCHGLIVKNGTILAVGRGGVERTARMAVDKAYDVGMSAIRNAYKNPFRVSKLFSFDDEVAKNTSFYFSFQGLGHKCPFCGHQELWQAESDKGLNFGPPDWSGQSRVQIIKGIPEESRPVCLDSNEAFAQWKKDVLIRQHQSVKEYWLQNADLREKVLTQLENLSRQISQLQTVRSSLGVEAGRLRSEIEKISAELKQYSMFSQERRQLNRQLSDLKKSLSACEKEDQNKEFSINQSIAELSAQRKKILVDHFGVLGELNQFDSKGKELFFGYRID